MTILSMIMRKEQVGLRGSRLEFGCLGGLQDEAKLLTELLGERRG